MKMKMNSGAQASMTRFVDLMKQRDGKQLVSVAVTSCVSAMLIAALAHVFEKVRKHGLYNAWIKSVLRKGSWTASFYHFLAMKKLDSLQKKYPNEEDRQNNEFIREERNIYGSYHKNTKERHTKEQKRQMREYAMKLNKVTEGK